MSSRKSSRHAAKYLLLVVLALSSLLVRAQQSIALIGTKHQTPETEIVQIQPVREAILQFKPDVFCVEYRKPDDSVSMRYMFGPRHYKKQDSIRRAWKMPAKKSDLKRINEL